MMPRCLHPYVFLSLVGLAGLPVNASIAQPLQLALCPGPENIPGAILQEQVYGIEGELLSLVISDELSTVAHCQSRQSIEAKAELLWSGLIKQPSIEIATSGLLLQGIFADQVGVTVSDITAITSQQPQGNEAPDFGENLVTRSQALVFGREERATWSAEQVLQCRAGQQRPVCNLTFHNPGPAPLRRNCACKFRGGDNSAWVSQTQPELPRNSRCRSCSLKPDPARKC